MLRLSQGWPMMNGRNQTPYYVIGIMTRNKPVSLTEFILRVINHLPATALYCKNTILVIFAIPVLFLWQEIVSFRLLAMAG